jgi:Zn-dependent protease
MTGAAEGLGRFGQVRTRLAGIDLEIQLVFVAWLVILGLASGRNDATLVTWVVVAALGVLIHELGHAFAYRAFGVQPRIVLSAVFGLTFGEELPPARSLVVSLAGPATGIALGLLSIGLAAVIGPDDGLARVVVSDLAFVGFGWAVLNLLPIQPLDGGQAVRSLIAATGWRNAERIALVISILAAAVIGVAALASGFVFLVLFMVWFAAGNLAEFQALGEDRLRAELNRLGRRLMEGEADAAIAGLETVARKARTRSVAESALTGRAFALLSQGRPEEAEEDLRRLSRPGAAELLTASIGLHHGRLDPALAAHLADHQDAVSAMGAARAILDTGRLDEVLELAMALPGDAATRALRALLVGLHFDGDHEAALRVGELLFDREPVWNEVAYFVASSHAALGRDEEALAWLARSAELGASYVTYIDRDANLARVRELPGYGPIHGVLAENSGGRPPDTGALLGDADSDVDRQP